jgi:hypothetical protein
MTQLKFEPKGTLTREEAELDVRWAVQEPAARDSKSG